MCAWLHPQAIIQVQLGKLHAVKSLIWMGWRRSQSTTIEDQSSDCYIWYCPYEATKRPSAWSSQAFGAWKTNNTARNDMDTYENNISELKILGLLTRYLLVRQERGLDWQYAELGVDVVDHYIFLWWVENLRKSVLIILNSEAYHDEVVELTIK